MKIKEALHNTARTLAANAVEEAPLEAELLLMRAMDHEAAGIQAWQFLSEGFSLCFHRKRREAL